MFTAIFLIIIGLFFIFMQIMAIYYKLENSNDGIIGILGGIFVGIGLFRIYYFLRALDGF